MKKNFMLKVFVFGLLLSFSSWNCEDQKEGPSIGPVPDTFSKKVLIEEFTGAWCGYCPDGALRLENIINQNDGFVIGVSAHSGDAMEVSQTSFLESTYLNPGYPSGMVDRFNFNENVSISRGAWDYVANEQLQKEALCGLAMQSKVNGNTVKIKVHAGFKTAMNGDHRLTVYLIENGVKGSGYGYDQANYYDSDSTSPFYGLGNPIESFEHNHTLRLILSEPLGDLIDPSFLFPKGEFIKDYEIDISSYNSDNLFLVAFVTYIGENYLSHEVLNAQKCEINGIQDWD